MTFRSLLLAVAFSAVPISAFGQATETPTTFLEVGDVKYAYRDIAPDAAGPPLVMITRYRANMDDWDPAFLDALAQERRVIVFNQSGIASSSGTVPTTIQGMAADVANFIGGMGLEDADVLGWSMGGFTAQALAIDHPELVRRLILVGTGPAASDRTPGPKDGVFEVATKPSRSDGETTYADADRAYLFFADDPYSADLAEASFARIDASRRADEPVTPPAVMEAQTAAIQDFWFNPENGYFAKLSAVEEPVLIVNGDNDAFFTVSAQAVLFSQFQDAQLAILPAAGHGPQHQHPEEVAGMIDRFLD